MALKQIKTGGGGSISRIDLVGHSLAGGGGATGANLQRGWIDKLGRLFYPASLRDSSKGGSMASMHEGGAMYSGSNAQTSGYARALTDFRHQDPLGPVAPYLPISQLAIVWHATNDVGWLGPQYDTIKEALRTEVCRFRAAHVFEDVQTTVQYGHTPITYTGAWRAQAISGVSSNGTWHDILTPYDGTTNYISCQVPCGMVNGGTLQFGFVEGTFNSGAVWEVHDVTGGTDTLLATWDLRGKGGVTSGQGNGAVSSARAVISTVRRLSIGAAPSTTLQGAQWTTSTTLTVASTTGFANSGVLQIGPIFITYTGKTATTFTGCTLVPSFYALEAPSGSKVTGTRDLQLRPVTIDTTATGGQAGGAMFDYWAIEATNPGLVVIPEMFVPYSFGIWAGWPYGQTRAQLAAPAAAGATQVTLTTATATNAIAATGNIGAVTGGQGFLQYQLVRVDNELMQVSPFDPNAMTMVGVARGAIGSTAATHTAGSTIYSYVRVGGRFTVGTGASAETRLITAVSGATVTLDSALNNAHTAGEPTIHGFQPADIGPLNQMVRDLAAEFTDGKVFTVPVDGLTDINGVPDGTKFVGDGVHPNDEFHSSFAKRLYDYIQPKLDIDSSAHASPLDGGSWYDTQWGMITLGTHWTSYTTSNATPANGGTYTVRFRKDMRTGQINIEGAVVCDAITNLATVIFTLPAGARPGWDITRVVSTQSGPAIISIKANGDVALASGGNVNYTELSCSFFAEG